MRCSRRAAPSFRPAARSLSQGVLRTALGGIPGGPLSNGIEQPTVVDLVAAMPDGAYKLVVVQTNAWDGSDAQLRQLQQKLDNYVLYVASGQMSEQYPQSKGAVG
jgi:hypothetical protein